MKHNSAALLTWSITLVFTFLCFSSPGRAQTEPVRQVDGKKPSLALLESEMKGHSGRFCGAKLSKLVHSVDDEGAVVTTLQDLREVPEAGALELARSLSPNQTVTVMYCEGSGRSMTTTGTAVAHAVWKKQTSWTAMVVKTGKSMTGRDPSRPDALTEAQVTQRLLATSRKMSASLPKMMGDSLRVDSVRSSTNVLLYSYTLVATKASEVKPDDFRRRGKSRLLPTVCKDEQARLLLRSGARFAFHYDDKDGKEITRINVVASDCQ